MNEEDKYSILNTALLAHKLHNEIYYIFSLFAKMPEDVKTDIINHHICGFDTTQILMDTFKQYFPNDYNPNISINDNIVKMELILRRY